MTGIGTDGGAVFPVSFGKSATEADGLGSFMFNVYGLRGQGEIQAGARVRLRGSIKPLLGSMSRVDLHIRLFYA